MPAMNFPSSPTNGQAYGQYVYDSTKGAWRVLADLIASAIPSPTAPTSPVSGDLWFNTNDGVLFMYFNDGNTSQWVEMKSNTASGSTVAARVDAIEAKPAGLVPISPTSVAVSSGSASIGSNGLVTFTGVGTIRLNGVFNNSYQNYLVYISSTMTAGVEQVTARLSASGTDYSGAYYRYIIDAQATTDATLNRQVYSAGTGASSLGIGYFTGWDGFSQKIIDIGNPALTKATAFAVRGNYDYGTHVYQAGSGLLETTSAYDGINFIASSGTMAGTVKVYGYR